MNTKELEKRCNELFFQVNEKTERIAELEKENAELKDYNKKLLQSDIDKQNKIVLLSKKVNDLQKENVGLKSEKGCKSCTKFDEVKLTKAKEIIKDFINYYLDNYNDYTMPRFERIKEAKEFVKKQNNSEVEK